MRVTDTQLRRRAFLFMRALAPFGVGPAFYAEAEPPAGGGAAPEGEGEGDKGKGKKKPAATPEKPEPKYTDDDLKRVREEAAAEVRREAQEKADADKAEREKEDAKKKGEWETVAKTAEHERDAARLEARSLRVDMMLRDHLAEKHPDYIAAAKWIRPAVNFDATSKDETIRQRIEEAAAAYVKDNPRSAKGGGAPATNPGGRIGRDKPPPAAPERSNGVQTFTGAAARF